MAKVITLLGTRPEIIRLSRVIAVLDELLGDEHLLVHTGQNYDERLSDIFFSDLQVRKPDVYMGVRADSFSEQIGQLLTKAEELFHKEKPESVLILGDTNTGIAAFVAKRMGIRVCHMEAGNRCFDDRVPEEVNRRVIDHSSTVLMPYTYRSAENLVREGIERQRVFVTGNPIKEVLDFYAADIDEANPFVKFSVEPGKYFLVTAHRAEMTDDPERLRSLIEALNQVGEKYGMPVLASLHPRTKNKMEQYGIDAGLINFVPPMGLFDFVRLEKEAFCVLSDSGTVQEECCIFGVPTVTMRDVTERPETIECGSNILAGVTPERIVPTVEVAIRNRGNWVAPKEYLEENVSDIVARIVIGMM